jgi:heme exporter protein D
MSLGPHAAFIWSSYAAMALGMAGLLAWLFVDGRKQKKALADFEARGVRRRSAEPAQTTATKVDHS